MMTLLRSFYIFTLLFFVNKMTAQMSPTVNMTFRSKLAFSTSGANICGYAADGKEYALFGNGQGMAIIDVTNPDLPVLLQQVPGLASSWREVKVYRNYAYVTTEANGSGLQIVNLSTLPSTAVYKTYSGGDSILTNIQKIHALHIDTAKGFVYLYGGNSVVTPIGGSATSTNGAAVVLDIKTDPWNPKFVGVSPKINNNSNDYYIHDGYVRGDTLFGGHIYAGKFSIIDFRDKKNPVLLNLQTTPTAFNHNSWLSDDSKTLFTTDENAGSYIGAYDVSNPFSIKFLDKIRTLNGATPIVHNVHVLNDFLVTSWYTEGVTIVDAHRPQNLIQVGQYDTHPGTATGFKGCWGVYPYLPSGNLVCSNLGATGGDTVYVVTPQYVRACYLEGTVTNATTGAVLSAVLTKINTSDMDKKAETNIQGIYRTGQVSQGTVSVTYSKTGYITQTITGIVLATGMVTIQNVALVPVTIPVELVDFQAVAVPQTAKGERAVRLTWETASETNVARFDVERQNLDNGKETWQVVGSLQAKNAASPYLLYDKSPNNSINYYRLNMVDLDGSSKLSKVVSVAFGDAQTPLFVYPNPAKNRVFLSNNTFNDEQAVEIVDITGKVVIQSTIGQGRSGFDIEGLPNGSYALKVGEGTILMFFKTL